MHNRKNLSVLTTVFGGSKYLRNAGTHSHVVAPDYYHMMDYFANLYFVY